VTANDSRDQDTGANNLQNAPVLSRAVAWSSQIVGSLHSTPSTVFWLDFYASPAGSDDEGQTSLGGLQVTTDQNGREQFFFPSSVAFSADRITATSTAPNGSTSEFSAARSAVQDWSL
jgi:hypothetical protein